MNRQQRNRAVRLGGFIAGAGVVMLGGLLVSAGPAAADNGPHISTAGNTTVDRCAGCHRAHTAEASYLLMQDEVTLCATCHGAGGSGAATDVYDGVGYTSTSRGTQAGALRGGGFQYALINGASGVNKASIGVLGSATLSTSAHSIDGTAQTEWGQGPISASANYGTSVNLECSSCHDPHGNGSWRLLRTVPNGGAALATPAPVGITSLAKNTTLSSGTTYYYDVVTAAANTFKVTDPVTVAGSTGANGIVAATVKTVTDSTHFTMSIRSVNVTTTVTDGRVGFALPNAVANAVGDGTTVTYTTWNVNGLQAGQKVNISGATPTAYNLAGATVVSAPANSNTFTVTNAATGTYASGGTVTGTTNTGAIPDALGKDVDGQLAPTVYTTTNYWAVDDHNYTGTYSGTFPEAAPTAVIANISQWCSTCHTRYMAGAGAYAVDSGDAVFTYRHRSQNGKENSPNCLQCHVAHGSSAQMSGTYSSNTPWPNGTAANHTQVGGGTVADSRLLRADNRGTCNMCHNV